MVMKEKNVIKKIDEMIINCNFSKMDSTKELIFSDLDDEFSFNSEIPMGIDVFNRLYIEINENQDRNEEYKKIIIFLNKFIEYYASKKYKKVDEIKMTFINYGKTELVYVLTDNDNKFTVLVKQPIVKFGNVYNELQNLLSLSERDEMVIAPIDYFCLNDQELYVTPYINQARCVASYGKWGMYIPEPYYRFENFTFEQEKVVTTCLIAKLVSLYDFKNQEGIIKCKLGGGDFMLPKGWEDEDLTIENTLNNLYLIAARDKIKCPYEEYLQIIKNEFSRSTINEDEKNIIINLRGRVPMDIECINKGINIGENLNNHEKTMRLSNNSF